MLEDDGALVAAARAGDVGRRRGAYLPHTVNVLTFTDDQLTAVTSFLDVTRRGVTGPDFRSFAATRLFDRFGLPDRLEK